MDTMDEAPNLANNVRIKSKRFLRDSELEEEYGECTQQRHKHSNALLLSLILTSSLSPFLHAHLHPDILTPPFPTVPGLPGMQEDPTEMHLPAGIDLFNPLML
jgi:hypothetical protein